MFIPKSDPMPVSWCLVCVETPQYLPVVEVEKQVTGSAWQSHDSNLMLESPVQAVPAHGGLLRGQGRQLQLQLPPAEDSAGQQRAGGGLPALERLHSHWGSLCVCHAWCA